jgi:hypothetical protein
MEVQMTNQHKRVARLAAFMILASIQFVSAVTHAQPVNGIPPMIQEDTGLILHDSFDNVLPFIRQNGVGEINLPAPLIGSPRFLRYYEPGEYINGAPNPSYINFGVEQQQGGYLSINYSGSDNGGATQDQVVYPVVPGLSPDEWTIDFWYRPHYDQNDASAIFYLLTSKDRHDSPYNINSEQDSSGKADFALAWAGWGGRKYFAVSINGVRADTPYEDQPNRVRFAAEQWMRMTVIWRNDGIPGLGDKTLALLINNKVVASTSQKVQTLLPFRKYLVVGASPACPFTSGAITCYSGASGDIDDIKVYNYAKSDFCEGVRRQLPCPV